MLKFNLAFGDNIGKVFCKYFEVFFPGDFRIDFQVRCVEDAWSRMPVILVYHHLLPVELACDSTTYSVVSYLVK